MAIRGPLLVTGGTGYTGRRLLRALAEGAVDDIRLLLRPTSSREALPSRVALIEGDLDDPASLCLATQGARLVLHLAHVRYAAALMAGLATSVERVVVVSSLRALSRVPSHSVPEVLDGERSVSQAAIRFTILRPSMIFGPGDDRNLSRLADRLRRSAWIPLPGAGRLHQPVFVDDVVDAVLAAAACEESVGRTYAIAGPEAMAYSDLVDAVGAAVGVVPRKVAVPVAPLAAALGALEGLGLRLGIEAEQVRRMGEDKEYDIEPAARDLGFAPRPFVEALATIHGSEGGRR